MTVAELIAALLKLPQKCLGYDVEVFYDSGMASTGVYHVNVDPKWEEVHLNRSADVTYTENG